MRALGLILAALALGGCSLAVPPPGGSAGAGASTAAVTGSNEIPTPPGPVEHGRGAAGPEAALRAFATRYVNWHASEVAGDLRRLALTAVGQARTALQLEAAQVGADPSMIQDGIYNSGTVAAVAPVSGRSDRWVVVTFERTGATASNAYAGVGPGWHLALAGVTRRAEGWVVDYFQPES